MNKIVKTPNTTAAQTRRALLTERLRAAATSAKRVPLSFAQQRLWFLDQLHPNSPLYNIATLAQLDGALNVPALEYAINAVIARHESLRTHFICPEEIPLQVIEPQAEARLRSIDLASRSETQREAEAQALIREEINRPFNLSTQPLLRAVLLRLQPDEHRLLLVIHHIVADEWSLKVFFRELGALYAGKAQGTVVGLPELPIQYADYSEWQRNWLQGEVLEQQLGYWKQQLGSTTAPTELPADRARRPAPTFSGGNAQRLLSGEVSDGLRRLAQEHDATLFMVALGGFKSILHRYTQQEDLVVCCPIAGRNRIETEGLIGFFVNTLPLRTNMAGDPTFKELLARVREVTLGAYAHQELPFEKLVGELRPERSLNHMPFARLMFAFQRNLEDQIQFPGLQIRFLEAPSELAKFDATVVVQEAKEGLKLNIEYSRDLFDAKTIERLLEHFETLLRGIVAAPNARLSELPLLTPEERQQIVVDWNRTTTKYPRENCIHELFEAQVQQTPDATAVQFGQQVMRYRELNARANQLAQYLRQFGVGPDAPVGICMRRSVDLIVGLLGILKAGGAYLPLDPTYPKERLALMLADTQAPVVLGQQSMISILPRDVARVVCLDTDWELIARQSRQNLPGSSSPEDLAYVMYTSGSTGGPKGVAVPHRAVNRLVLNTNYIRLDASDRIAQVSNASFDAATFEIWGALLNGGQLVGITSDLALSPRDFARELRERGITAMFLTAALFNQLASEVPGAFETLRTLIVGGEALDPKWVRAVLKEAPPKCLVNGYGPTENTTFTCCHLVQNLTDGAANVPIGRPIANTRVYILDRYLNPVPVGVPGELYAGGDGLARGYWNRPELTAQKFVPSPFKESGPSLLYRTGDVARFLPEGSIEFLGRLDDQVKIRGFRVELGEIEATLGSHPDVSNCVVLAAGESSVTRRLLAYFVPKKETAPNASEFRAFLSEKLPEYMIPSAFIPLRALPLTLNGKVDRGALPAPDRARPELDRQYAAPQDEVESQLVRIWEKVLGVAPIGIRDKFFDLGGHSLLAVRVIAQIEKALGRKLRLATIFQAPTIEQLAAVLREEVKESSIAGGTSLVEIQGQGSLPPLYLVHGAAGGMFWGYTNLSRFLGSDQPIYAFKSRGLDGREEFSQVEEIAAQYVNDLRATQPRGPYFLGGYCFGGNVAFEMARQLSGQGETVAFLALLNCAAPNSRYDQIPWTARWASRLVRNLIYWGGYVWQWTPMQRREFFRWKTSLMKKRLAGLFCRPVAGSKRIDPWDLVDLSGYTEEQKKIWEAHIGALLNFHPQPFGGHVHLFRSPGHPFWCSFDPDYGWGDFAQGGVTIEIVPGAHEKILEEPCVRVVASKLKQALAAVRTDANRIERLFGPEITSPSAAAANRSGPCSGQAQGEDARLPAWQSFSQAFAAQVERRPSDIAARFDGEELTYAQLDERANQLARYLQALGVAPEVLVGVCLERSLDLLVTLLAIFKAGGAYLPLDPSYPQERLAYMLDDSKAGLLITQSRLVADLPTGSRKLLTIDDPEEQERIKRHSVTEPVRVAALNHLAYVIYTSGSTGTPKGVEITQGALLSHNLAVAEAYQLTATDRVLQFTPLSFDISVEEIFPTWLQGGAVVLRKDAMISSAARFLQLVAQERITVLNLPTAYWHELVDDLNPDGAPLPECLRLVVIGGEKASDEAYRKWKQCVGSSVALVNSYGVTEATVTTTFYTAQAEDDSLVIGRPIGNSEVMVLNEHLQPVPEGTAGELYVGGKGLARGYLNRPELTGQRFIPNPFPEQIGSPRLYKTGDIVRLRSDGNLEFIGRADEQVKIRGYRIELGEIEAILRSHQLLKDAVVRAHEDRQGKRRLVAYVVPRTATRNHVTELVAFLKKKVPGYLIPSAFVPLPALPLTPAGKLDRQALPAPAKTRPALEEEFVSPRMPLELTLAQIWGEVLDLQPVGIHDNFFELGGHSLLAIQALSRIRENLQLEISLADFFARPTVAQLGAFAAELAGQAPAGLASVSPRTGRTWPLSENPRRIWFLDRFEPQVSAYNRAIVFRLSGNLNFSAIEDSLTQLSNWQEALRVVLSTEAGEPSQFISEPQRIALRLIDLSPLPETEREQQAITLATQEARRAQVASEPMLRPLLVRLTQTEHWLVLIVHEIAADSWSLKLLAQELPKIYESTLGNERYALPALPLGYSEALTAAGNVPLEQKARHVEFWKRQLAGVPELLDSPADRPRLVQGSARGRRCPLRVPQQHLKAATTLNSDRSDSLFTALLSTLATLLHRYTGSTDIVIGSVASNRRRPESKNLVGNFENLIPLRCDLSGDPSFRELQSRLERVVQSVLAHSELPFGKLLEELHLRPTGGYTPLFQVLLLLEDQALPVSRAGNLEFAPFEVDCETSKFDLTFRLVRTPSGLEGWIEYSTALFDHARIARMSEHFLTLFHSATQDPETRISVLPLCSEHETKQLLLEWNDTQKPYPSDKSLIDLFEDQVARTPDAEALVSGISRLTYAQLCGRAKNIAGRLKQSGVGEGSLVGICLTRSADMVAAILGTLMAGAAYVPMDPAYPADRLAFILEDAQLAVLLTQSKLLGSLPRTNATVLCIDTLAHEVQATETTQAASATSRAKALAYVIYTSGSTGRPKGVALEHHSAVAFVCWAKDVFTPEELSGVLASTSICFDLSVFEMFVPLSWGGKLILAENALALPSLPAAQEVKLVNTVPSALRELLRMKGLPASVEVVNLAGEPLSTELVDQIYNETSVRKVYDLYGPTETTTYSTFSLRRSGEPATIGRPLANEQVCLLDSHLQLVPIGIPGELYIGGDGLARGYLNRPELTAERFVAHPFQPGARLYRTGDLARWRADGNLEYLGRIDHQVKIRGFRIELGEIETVLKTNGGAREVIVLAREDHPGDKRLVAYIVREPGKQISPEDFRTKIREKLPKYMVPSAFVFLDALPMTPNGKVDRKALPAPEYENPSEDGEFVAPRTALEEQVAGMWREVLHLGQVGVNQNFFDLGGHSLMAVRVLSRVREVFKVELPFSSIFTAPTIAAFCEGLASGQWTNDRTPMLPIEAIPRLAKSPLSFVQERLWFLDQLEPGSHAYNVPAALRFRGELDVAALENAINGVISRHESLRASFSYSDGNLVQIIRPSLHLELPLTDLQSSPPEQADSRAQDFANQEAQRPFDLAAGPLVRARLIRLSPTEHVFIVVMHHTVSDGWSLALFFQELAARYEALVGGTSRLGLPELPLQYVDFAHWQRQWMQGAVLDHELAYWKNILSAAPSAIDLPTDRNCTEQSTRRAERQVISLENIEKALAELGRAEGCTPFIILMAALHITLHKWTQAKDLVVGTVVAGRNRREWENVIGCFMNFLPIRARINGGETGRDVLARVRSAVLEGQVHQDCPFEKVVEAINPQRRLNQNPLYNVALLLQNFPVDLFQVRGIEAKPWPVRMQAALLDLRFEAEHTARGLSLSCEYKTELFDDTTITQLLDSYARILEALVRTPAADLGKFELSTALEEQAKAARARKQKPAIKITGTFTCEPIAEPLRYWLLQLALPASIEFAPYNQVFQQLLDSESIVGLNPLGLNLLLVRLEDWERSGAVAVEAPASASDENLERTVGEFAGALKAAAARRSTPYLVCFCPPSARAAGERGRAEFLTRMEDSLCAAFEGVAGIYVLSTADLAKWYPVADYYDASGEELGHVPYTPVFFTALATAVARKFHALNRPAHKVIVLDCDQTLWSGVCGEDGAKGIRLEGPWLALQRFMRAQQDAGMLLCLCSKNNEQDVLDVFTHRLDMPLRREHFTAWRLNWLPKSENLKSLSQELGLALDSFIFLDDNPIECAEVEANCPEVLTLQLPEDTGLIPQFLNHCWAFDHLKLTQEDRRRSELYRQNQQREKLRAQAPNLSDFLAGLDLKVSVEQISPQQYARVAQLTQRTNQFNFSTHRYSEPELLQLLTRCEALTVRVSDRFGDYGLVGVMIYEKAKSGLEVDSFLLSCRVLGRGVEHQMLARLGELARKHRADWVNVHFSRSDKNKPALDFLENVGTAFKQPLNGGYLFRFPAGFASEVTFYPIASKAPAIAEGSDPPLRAEVSSGSGRKFTECRSIALQASDATKIYERIQAAVVLRSGNRAEYAAPRTELEGQLCELWKNLLHVERVGVHDDFFELGGHSLLAVRLFVEIEKLTGRKFPLITLFQASTVEALAEILEQAHSSGAIPSLLVPIQPRGSKPPLFLIHGAGGDVLWGYANLAQHLPPDQPVFGLKSRGQAGLEEYARLEDMARCYLQVVREFQPHGPYYLGGYCFGGNVAYEMARQLRIQGETVGLVALLDSAPANAGYETVPWWRPAFLWRFTGNLWHWLKDFAALQPEQRRSFCLRKARCFARKIVRRLRRESGTAAVDVDEVIDPSHIPANELKLWQIHLQALTNHIEQPYDGEVVLLRTRGQALFCSLEEDFCWHKLAGQGAKVVFVPGSHESIFMEPNVQALARELGALLKETETRPEPERK